ncbi:hypothetical protein PIB30_009720 [Stylosanthes scabra]|uniref:Uncharacterized protein n=1 Tax=Stylosanthes scabra TaxID=79078 RepID=A0ABU6W4M8_9FABA|nr:hypothetical protein [Stylosanthes scabra]
MSTILVPNNVLDTPEEPLHPPLHGAAASSVGPRIAEDQPIPVDELTEITVNSEENGRALGIGTFAYDAPEYPAAMSGKLNAESAVCSLSVVLLKLLVGKKAVDHTLASALQSLLSWGIPKDMHCLEEKLGGGGDCPTKACC